MSHAIQQKKKCCCGGWKLTPCYEARAHNCFECDGDWECGVAPESYTVTVEGVDFIDSCKHCSGTVGSGLWDSPPTHNLNGTFVIGPVGDPECLTPGCDWALLSFNSADGDWKRWLSEDCTDGAAITEFNQFDIRLRLRPNPVTDDRSFLQISYRLGSFVITVFHARFFPNPGCGSFVLTNEVGGPRACALGGENGTATLVPGDGGGGRCPGGSPVIVSNDLSAHDGNVITLTEDAQEVCYTVTQATSEEVAAAIAADELVTLEGTVIESLIECGTDCQDCCDDNCP